MKTVKQILTGTNRHWVGNGFYVSSIFSYSAPGLNVSPFLLLDYAAPHDFPGDGERRGVGAHPHKGFETVTLAYQGEVEHRDSSGGGGKIGPGDVQWMTAGSGLLHEEFHSDDFSKAGGTFEMVQLWVNLPAKFKNEKPRYQTLLSESIPVVQLPDDAGSLRVIAGEYESAAGPAHTYSPVQLWDVTLKAGASVTLPMPEKFSAVLVQAGSVTIGDTTVEAGSIAVLDSEQANASIAATADARLLVLGGEPIDEPIAGQGPFVMNTQEELRDAYAQFRSGAFGNLP